jgi:transcriptional regulator with XRE-family HTH domain
MKTYHFTIVVRDAQIGMTDLEDRLFEAGCDDALLCSYNQTVYLEFDREAINAEQAIKTALADIKAAGFRQPVVQEAGVSTLSEMADRAGITRAAFSLYARNKRGDGHFPSPVYGVASGSALYSWPEVSEWLYKQGKLAKEQYDIAHVALGSSEQLSN